MKRSTRLALGIVAHVIVWAMLAAIVLAAIYLLAGPTSAGARTHFPAPADGTQEPARLGQDLNHLAAAGAGTL